MIFIALFIFSILIIGIVIIKKNSTDNKNTNIVDNIICRPGSYWNAATGACSLCETGSYSLLNNSRRCIPCDFGYTSNATRTDCVPEIEQCYPGTYKDPITNRCLGCEADTYTNTQNATSCKQCDPGYTVNTNKSDCLKILAPTGTDCPPGAYINESNLCVTCPWDKISKTNNATMCSSCNIGYVPNDTHTECVYVQPEGCPPGSVRDQMSLECTICNFGSELYSPGGDATSCSICPPGTTPNATRSACV